MTRCAAQAWCNRVITLSHDKHWRKAEWGFLNRLLCCHNSKDLNQLTVFLPLLFIIFILLPRCNAIVIHQ